MSPPSLPESDPGTKLAASSSLLPCLDLVFLIKTCLSQHFQKNYSVTNWGYMSRLLTLEPIFVARGWNILCGLALGLGVGSASQEPQGPQTEIRGSEEEKRGTKRGTWGGNQLISGVCWLPLLPSFHPSFLPPFSLPFSFFNVGHSMDPYNVETKKKIFF